MVPWYQRGGTWYNIVQMWWNLVPKVGVPVPSLYESVPIRISSMDDFRIPRTNFLSFNSADSDADDTVTCPGVVSSCQLVSRGTDVDLFSEFVIFIIYCTILIALSPEIAGAGKYCNIFDPCLSEGTGKNSRFFYGTV